MDGKRREGGLPPGWRREEVVRKSGLSAGKTDVYYYSPDGKKIRSKPQLARALGDAVELSAFDFRTGRVNFNACRKSKGHKGSSFDFARGLRHDTSLILPIRQTASIFKQPVTLIRNRPESKTKSELKHGPQDQPRQLFWEKRLQGLKPFDNSEEVIQSMDLPRNMQGVGPNLSTENILQSISAALHLGTLPVTGQLASKGSILKNPGVNIDANQPLIQQMLISDEDIRRQEMNVRQARRNLQEAMLKA
ncbi:methyl-CpG-binding domain protein 3 isoform X1 [Patella vulgata]|uniref:methyl-CpG-binding domain protein 3 isoform X1 n=1 Tax=Patella vulgata TaxID=6465 RepID=UPI00217F9F66|nr:methyl-CpG-binding domain protein 3 isoform X1 [Patella vulgata]